MEIINYGYIREENRYLKNISKDFVGGEFFGKKNLLYGIDKSNQTEYIPININDSKIIIISADIKKEDIAKKINRSYENAKLNMAAVNNSLSSMGYESDDKYENYIFNEIKRTETILYGLKKGKLNELQTVMEKGIIEFANLMEKSREKFIKLYETIKKSGMCELVLSAYEYNGIAAIVKDGSVDDFVERMSDECEKKEGSAPSFYICDTAASGIELIGKN